MSYKTILATLDSQATTPHVAKFASAIAKRFDAHLIGLHVGTLPTVSIIAPMEVPDPSTVIAMQDVAALEAEEIRIAFEQSMTAQSALHQHLSYEWKCLISAAGFASAGAIENARCSDLIIARQNDSAAAADKRTDIDSFLYESGRPVLLLPCSLQEPKPIERVLIAWNGSREATRAAFDALPFLKQASHVDIFSFGKTDSSMREGEQRLDIQLAQVLSRHGVKVSSSVREKDSGTTAQEAISQRLTDQSADLLVMGAYGSARWWEMLFGGVTRGFLDSMTAMTLMSR
jgi:nucleotide-binding universal stress UspA family protein